MDTVKSLAAEEAVTRSGNPRKPQGEDGEKMLQRMNESHAGVTGWALEFLHLEEDSHVLDIGCGGGATLGRMSAQIHTGHLTGIDYSAVSVQVSKDWNAEDIRSGKMDILEGSVEKLPFADGSFDRIITVESFYFWPDPQENLREVFRVLKKDGIFLLVADIYQKDDLGEKAKENIRRYRMFNPTKEEFEELFLQAGFASVEIHTKEGEDWICIAGRP